MEQPDIIVGNNLKRLREERNLSYTQLAELTGVSKSMLRQIEIGESSPTINTLWKITNGLEVPFSTLINRPDPKISLRKIKDQPPLIGKKEGYRVYPLIPFGANRSFEIYYVEIEPEAGLDADPHTGNAEEIMIVIQGAIELTVQNEITTVCADEVLSFDATHPHHYHNPLNELTKAFMVISYSA